MTTKQIDDAAWKANPFTYRNNRGGVKTKDGRYLTYGIPEPPRGRKERDDEPKGGDRIGFRLVEITPDMVGNMVPVFASIEIKSPTDRLKEGQINWHNMMLSMGAISEIWQGHKDGSIEVIKERIDD